MLGISLTILIAAGVISYQSKRHQEQLSKVNEALADLINAVGCVDTKVDYIGEEVTDTKNVIFTQEELIEHHIKKATDNLFWRMVSTPMKVTDK